MQGVDSGRLEHLYSEKIVLNKWKRVLPEEVRYSKRKLRSGKKSTSGGDEDIATYGKQNQLCRSQGVFHNLKTNENPRGRKIIFISLLLYGF